MPREIAGLNRADLLTNPNPKFKRTTTPSIFYSAPPFLSLCVYWNKGHPGKLSTLKKSCSRTYGGHFSKIVLKKVFGFAPFLAPSATWGAPHKKFDPEKNCINSAGAFFRHMRAPKNRNREDEAEKIQRKISKISKKIGRDIFQKPFFNAFFAFSEEFIFFVLQFF